jgi:DNA-binding transcriptional MerR regulator
MRIGELADQLGITTKAIRFYEQIGLLPDPPRTPSGYRSYEDGDVERLVFIKTAKRLGLSLDEIREVIAFRDRGEQPCEYVAEVLQRQVTDLDERIREMRALRDELNGLQARAAQGVTAAAKYCGVIEHPHLRRSGAASASGTAAGFARRRR